MTTTFAGLDDVLNRVAKELQLTDTQYARAKSEYNKVGEWLDRPQSPFHGLSPKIYPQGSMALRTTVAPKNGTEYDLDLVLQLDDWRGTIKDLHGLLSNELHGYARHENKQEISVKSKARCARLAYSKSFHLDVVPARKDAARGRTNIEVPDKQLTKWLPNDPCGYLQWFEDRCVVRRMVLAEARQQAPLPANSEVQDKAPLKRAVQLIKRRRDRWYPANQQKTTLPASIVLTTVIAQAYEGGESTLSALEAGAAGIERLANAAPPSLLNPTNYDEDFCENWGWEQTYAFRQFAAALVADLQKLARAERASSEETSKILHLMFGEQVDNAYCLLAEDARRLREAGTLRVSQAGTIGATGASVQRHTFFGQ